MLELAKLCLKEGRIRPQDIGRALDGLQLKDLGRCHHYSVRGDWLQTLDFRDRSVLLHPGRFPRIASATYFENRVACCAFLLPPGSVLPLHDHPTQVVVQKVLCGTATITSYDWDRDDPRSSRAVVVDSKVKYGPDTPASSFGPVNGGVLHEIRNDCQSEPLIFIDIISPPYHKPPQFISCTYYTLARPRENNATVVELDVAHPIVEMDTLLPLD